MDDRTVGLVLRALRRRRGWRQVELAKRAGCSQATVSVIERGHLTGTTIATLRSVFTPVEARLQVAPLWRGAELERLVDEDHATIVARLADRLERAGWHVLVEVTYSIAGERGSVDVLGHRADVRAVAVCEVKSDIAAAEKVGRKLDEKARLAGSIVRARLGWAPASVAVLLVLPESNRLRRLLAGAAVPLARMFPVASRRVAGWLAEPDGPLAATWFLSGISARSARRVRRPRTGRYDAASDGRSLGPNLNVLPEEPPSRILR